LLIEKTANAQGSYDDGIFIRFGEKRPQHITLELYTDDADIETCDLRLTTVENATKPNTTTPTTANTTNATRPAPVSLPARENFTKVAWQDVAFFRFGYFNYQKLNLVSMVNKFILHKKHCFPEMSKPISSLTYIQDIVKRQIHSRELKLYLELRQGKYSET
jgi:hypothetical protein